jgi:hypothetical protein
MLRIFLAVAALAISAPVTVVASEALKSDFRPLASGGATVLFFRPPCGEDAAAPEECAVASLGCAAASGQLRLVVYGFATEAVAAKMFRQQAQPMLIIDGRTFQLRAESILPNEFEGDWSVLFVSTEFEIRRALAGARTITFVALHRLLALPRTAAMTRLVAACWPADLPMR